MDYNKEDFNEVNISSELDLIQLFYSKIDEHINNYNNKFKNLNDKILSLSAKQYLDINSSLDLLKYQKNLVKVEVDYFTNQKINFTNELKNQLYKLSEKITILYISLLNINKDIKKDLNNNNDEQPIKRSFLKDDYSKIISDILENFSNIKELLLNLKKYNIDLDKELNDKNYHCRTLNNNINNKRILIYINYKKSYDIFMNTLKYFSEYSGIIITKITQDFNYKFLVNITEDTNDNDNTNDVFIKENERNIITSVDDFNEDNSVE